MEAPPNPHQCLMCDVVSSYWCSNCFSQPMYCMACCRNHHWSLPFHQMEQWTGLFFKKLSLGLIGYALYLSHNGHSCPKANNNKEQPMHANQNTALPDDEQAWTDMDAIPLHLHPPSNNDYMTIVDVSNIHFITIRYYNLECGTLGMNYFSKLRCITSNVFPHAVLDQYRDLLRVARQWRVLKLWKWQGFGHREIQPDKGELVLFCPACPQPGINMQVNEAEQSKWVWLMDGQGYMVGREDYKAYLKSTCNNHWAVNQANAGHGKLEVTGIGATACTRHGCFFPHTSRTCPIDISCRQVNMDYSLAQALRYNMQGMSDVLRSQVANNAYIEIWPEETITPGVRIWYMHGYRPECYARYALLFILGVGWVDGEVLETLWSLLNTVSGLTWSMTSSHRQELLDFQMNDSNFMKMIRMSESESKCVTCNASKPFLQQEWGLQEKEAQERRISDSLVMDIFDLYLSKDQLSRQISAFLVEAKIHLSPNNEDGIQWGDSDSDCNYVSEECTLQDTDEDLLDRVDGKRPDCAYIPLPSNIGHSKCVNLGLQNLVDMELKLQVSQADDTLYEICIRVAEKAVLFRHGLRRVGQWLGLGGGANKPTLAHYQVLWKEHLNTTTSATNLNARGLRYEVLPWYFNLDMEHNTESSTYMLEFLRVHWLWVKATKDWWIEEEELLHSEFEWTISFFKHHMEQWRERVIRS
ncbi:hypothetical protein V8E55_001305 [Tylopilus felleus]